MRETGILEDELGRAHEVPRRVLRIVRAGVAPDDIDLDADDRGCQREARDGAMDARGGADMKSRAAVLFESPGRYEVVEVDVDDPKEHEVLVRYVGERAVPQRRAFPDRRPCGPAAVLRRPRGRGCGRSRRARCRLATPRGSRRGVVHPELRPVPLLRLRPDESLPARCSPPGRPDARRHLPDAPERRRPPPVPADLDLLPIRCRFGELFGEGGSGLSARDSLPAGLRRGHRPRFGDECR